jgi:hypothetical protein
MDGASGTQPISRPAGALAQPSFNQISCAQALPQQRCEESQVTSAVRHRVFSQVGALGRQPSASARA